jgi:hypothetical protein
VILLELLQVAPAAAADPGLGGELVELAKLLGGGAAGTFALLAWQALRSERSQRSDERERETTVRAERQRELDGRLERMATTLARIDERTQLLTHGERRQRRLQTPPLGTPIGKRKATESDP